MIQDGEQATSHAMETSREAVLGQLDAIDAELADAAQEDRVGIYHQLMQWFEARTLSEDDTAWVAERAQEMALQYGILDVTHPDARM